MWSSQHFKYTYFLNKNIGEQSLLPTPVLHVPTPLFLPLTLTQIMLSLPAFTEGAPLHTAEGS